jgi:hypothetical protein
LPLLRLQVGTSPLVQRLAHASLLRDLVLVILSAAEAQEMTISRQSYRFESIKKSCFMFEPRVVLGISYAPTRSERTPLCTPSMSFWAGPLSSYPRTRYTEEKGKSAGDGEDGWGGGRAGGRAAAPRSHRHRGQRRRRRSKPVYLGLGGS